MNWLVTSDTTSNLAQAALQRQFALRPVPTIPAAIIAQSHYSLRQLLAR